jgi:hypothetical protein
MHRLEEEKQAVCQAFPVLFAAFAARIGDGSGLDD